MAKNDLLLTYYIELKNANVISGLMADKGASVAGFNLY